MKKSKLALMSILIFVITVLSSCSDLGTACTTEFITYHLYVKGDTLTEYYTVRMSTNDTLREHYDEYFPEDNEGRRGYAILTDGHRSVLNGKKEGFIFVGKIENQKVIEEFYVFGGGECHIYKVSGKEKITLGTPEEKLQ